MVKILFKVQSCSKSMIKVPFKTLNICSTNKLVLIFRLAVLIFLRLDKHSRSMASDDSSIDDSELSPDKNGSITPEAEGKEARKERKRLKREEKEKRREERRKKKLLKSQESLVCNIVEGKDVF